MYFELGYVENCIFEDGLVFLLFFEEKIIIIMLIIDWYCFIEDSKFWE